MPPKTNNALDLKQLLLMPYQYSVSVGRRLVSLPDVMVLLLLATAIYAIFMLGQGWRDEYRPAVEISLSLSALPGYALQSALRGLIAYALSLIFTLIVGYAAAKSKWGEMILIPALDILQSIPVLGFLPGLVLGLIAIFPNSNTGLELAAIIMIFTGQVWNMVFTYYASLKSIPRDYADVSQLIGLTPYSDCLNWNCLLPH
jgi:NitT/TauT family transport system permease protein